MIDTFNNLSLHYAVL